MSSADWMEILLFIACILLLSPLLGRYIYDVFTERSTLLSPLFAGVEKFSYAIARVDPEEEMGWWDYAKAMLFFNFWGWVLLIAIQKLQYFLPFNPQQFAGVSWLLALNTSSSYTTHTDWQAYAGETTMSYLTQMVGLAVQNFLSAATGLAVMMAFIRGIKLKRSQTIGNFWVDLVRSILYILLPFAFVFALVLVSQGVVQTLNPYAEAITVEGERQTIPLGPVASQVAIKQLGSNGGGFFRANSAHPFENPTRLSNFLECLALVLIPTALPLTFGLMARTPRRGWLFFILMLSLWGVGLALSRTTEAATNPLLGEHSWIEGKEQRFGMTRSILWSNSTTATANGSTNASEVSLMPLTKAVALFNMMTGEIIFGGIGVGLCRLLIFAMIAVFLGGILVGKTPEFLGKKLGGQEVQLLMFAFLIPPALVLLGAAFSSRLPQAMEGLSSSNPPAFTELLFTFISTGMNNGIAYARLNSDYYNLFLSFVMIAGRLAILIPSLALAGHLAKKSLITIPSEATFIKAHSYGVLIVSLILFFVFLTYYPSLMLGPIGEHLLLMKGERF